MKKNIYAISIALVALSTSCKSDATNADKEYDPTKVEASAPVDSAVYELGQVDGRKLLEKMGCSREFEEELLDVKARIHHINHQVGKSAADDYTKGFTEYIKANNDSLARILF